ncbi:MAG: UDP-glucose 4-epimerase GalE [Phycisphaerae bacterium]|nr:UDP-glucose 4-epimerase GalE [Phycisphaerae bacterium]
MHVLVTGGAGFIGSHASLRLLDDGHQVTVVDNLFRGHQAAVDILANVGGSRCRFIRADLGDTNALTAALRGVDAVMHFAALTYVGESVEKPLDYWRGNLAGTLSLLEAMSAAQVTRMVLSSTCATYGEPPPERVPIDETCPQMPVNPYGRSKLACERIILDHAEAQRRAGRAFGFAFLRYFNVCGVDPAGRIGEDHRPETHLIPICLDVALGTRDALTIFGEDWSTPDGTCVRDYVHVADLVDAHVLVSSRLGDDTELIYNVGTGTGHSVRAVLDSCRRVTGLPIPAKTGSRRAGDPPALVNSPGKIRSELGWQARRASLDVMVEDAWRWRRAHPRGYAI